MPTPATPPDALTDDDLSMLATQAAAERACVVYWSPTGTRYAPELLAALVAAARRERRLRAALEPFAKYAAKVQGWADTNPVGHLSWSPDYADNPTIGDVRRARAVLED